jgi:hypothetical protein
MITVDGETSQAPDWEDLEVQNSIYHLLLRLGQVVREQESFLFADVGVLGWMGSWSAHWGPFRN